MKPRQLARDQGITLPVSVRILWERMNDRKLLVATELESRSSHTVRHVLQGHRRGVIHIRPEALCAQ